MFLVTKSDGYESENCLKIKIASITNGKSGFHHSAASNPKPSPLSEVIELKSTTPGGRNVWAQPPTSRETPDIKDKPKPLSFIQPRSTSSPIGFDYDIQADDPHWLGSLWGLALIPKMSRNPSEGLEILLGYKFLYLG